VPLQPGVWRSGTGSINLLECRLDSVCAGGNASADAHPFMYCRDHHVGPLCEVGPVGILWRVAVPGDLCALFLLPGSRPRPSCFIPARPALRPPHGPLQLCEPGYAMDLGECTECLTGTFGRVTTFGLVVFTVGPVLALVGLLLYFLKVRHPLLTASRKCLGAVCGAE
jgi:hypothetical protein